MSTIPVAEIEDDLNINPKDSPIVKAYKTLKIGAGILVASLTIFIFAGKVYNVPEKLENNIKAIAVQELKINDHEKSIFEVKNDVTNVKSEITGVKKSLDEVKLQQSLSGDKIEQVNRSLIELNTTLKFYSESMKEMRQDIKEIKTQTKP
jgi:chromosome segregation ATPase